MDREGFRNRLKQYKLAREENPGLKYWEWKDIPKYDEGTDNVTYDPIELRRNIQRVLNTTPEGNVNPFYNSLDDTYGSVLLPEVTVTAPYTRKASLAQQAKRGAKAYYDAGKNAAPLLATIPLSAGILGTASTLGWGTAMDLIDIATNPTDPLSYIDKFDIATFKKVDPMSKDAKPISDKIFVDDAKVAGSTTVKPTYLDYGAVSFEDNFLNERPLWVKDVQEFYDTDVATRERNAASAAGVYYYLPFIKNRSKLTFNTERPVYVREYLDNVDFGGYANKDMVVIDKNSPFTPDEVLVHEGAHLDQFNGKTLPFDLMSDPDIRETIANFMTDGPTDLKYKSFLLEKLDDAYEFTEDFGKNIHETLEKGATNREMRYNLWLKNNKPNVDELNDIIDGMSDDDIIYMLTQTNSYSRNVHKNLLESSKDKKDVAASIRTALKTVPVLGAPIILNSTNDTQSQFAEGGEVGDNDFMKLFGKQVSYKPEETSWWSNVKNWWNDLTGMKNYAYGNCATTPNGKHTKECAHYSNSVLRNRGYKNIVGDAWTRAANSGMKKITSGYDGLTKPTEWDESDAHDYLQSAANNFINNVDTTALNPYDVIGLYYPDSPNTKKAFEQGRWGETQTHTGHIAVGNDGTHYVVHNVGGHLKMNKLADMLTGDYDYLPVSAYRPKK